MKHHTVTIRDTVLYLLTINDCDESVI